uniref:Kinesin motor domain-containing protein n=1 Tax=Mucochytrium quahogii TaxID=96639 RepID=A0A7S2SAU4_9STRA|mmetsp:Transcript_36413/g.58490  ORF Transcript_36413/g.58490 Transcript_36413/m.58490 type:complete len:816 (-) Transcript_36413:1386-3833(-)|eukprot:CAMPEP_0203745198 /NCGR_PEP_ID=MMETSP0098-20131031/1004_1 /ASSEMBLY_ACC=CAM_ASM_000208 /TAXON_ID=96639 /ORGANISM=" , Strain NY0313808BC1" /LENGTH=815 /DNA_ID=CAMNT_0050632911 /DNA_START=3009 /DNA_END=5456 /DNA_ORIENTATION=+
MNDEFGFSSLPDELVQLAERLSSFGGEESDTRVGGFETIARVRTHDGITGPNVKSKEKLALDESIAMLASRLDDTTFVKQLEGRGTTTPPARNVWVENGDVHVRKQDMYDSNVSTNVKRYRCNVAFSHNTSNLDFSNAIVPRLINEWLLDGFNVSVVATGKRDSGKTFALFGKEFNPEDPEFQFAGSVTQASGSTCLLWRTLYGLFDAKLRIPSLSFGISMWDIGIDDKVTDLLGEFKQGTGGANSCVISCPTINAAARIIAAARKRSCNWASGVSKPGRAHAFVRIDVIDHIKRRSSSIHFVDLVGSGKMDSNNGSDIGTRNLQGEEQSTMNRQLLSFSKLIGEISRLEITKQSVKSLQSARDSELTRFLAPLLTGNQKCFFLSMLTNQAQDWKQNCATLRLATKAGLINTACLRSKEIGNVHFCPFKSSTFDIDPAPIVDREARGQDNVEDKNPKQREQRVDACTDDEDIPEKSAERVKVKKKKPTRMRQNLENMIKIEERFEQNENRDLLSNENKEIVNIRPDYLDQLRIKLKTLQRELDSAKADFIKQKQLLEQENNELSEWCKEASKNNDIGAIYELYSRHCESAHQNKINASKMCKRIKNRTSGDLRKLDVIDFVRWRIKDLRDEISELERELTPLRKRENQFNIRDRWLSQMTQALKQKTAEMKDVDSEMASKQELLESARQKLQKSEEEHAVLYQTTDALLRDRKETSDEVVLMRKYISKTETEAEKQTLIESLNYKPPSTGNSDTGIPNTVETLVARLDVEINQKNSHLAPHTSKLRSTLEKLGLFLNSSERREETMVKAFRTIVK